jgi:hypothetical protein
MSIIDYVAHYGIVEIIGTAGSMVESYKTRRSTTKPSAIFQEKSNILQNISSFACAGWMCWDIKQLYDGIQAGILSSGGRENIRWGNRNVVILIQFFFAAATIYGIVQSIFQGQLPPEYQDACPGAKISFTYSQSQLLTNFIYCTRISLKLALSIIYYRRELYLMNAALFTFNLYHSSKVKWVRVERTYKYPRENEEWTASKIEGIFGRQRMWQRQFESLTALKRLLKKQKSLIDDWEKIKQQPENLLLKAQKLTGIISETTTLIKILGKDVFFLLLDRTQEIGEAVTNLYTLRSLCGNFQHLPTKEAKEHSLEDSFDFLHSYFAPSLLEKEEEERTDPQYAELKNATQFIIKEVTFSCEFLLLPSIGPKECSVCYEQPEFYFCSSHAVDLKCLINLVYHRSELWMSKSEFLPTDYYKDPITGDRVSSGYKITLSQEHLLRCPECRGPFMKDNGLAITFKDEDRPNCKIRKFRNKVEILSHTYL